MFDCLVSAYKHLLLNHFPDIERPFVFIRAKLDKIPEAPVIISYNRLIANRYYQADVFSGAINFGMIIFGVQP